MKFDTYDSGMLIWYYNHIEISQTEWLKQTVDK